MILKQWGLFVGVALVAGLAAGVFGAVATESYLDRYRVSLEEEGIPPRLSGERPRDVVSGDTEALWRVRDHVLPSLVSWYRTVPEGSSVVRGSYVPSEAIGFGSIISSDGWVVTTTESIQGLPVTQLTGVIGGRVVDVTAIVKDPTTSVVFVKTTATNVPVLSFADTSRLEVGDGMFVLGAGGSMMQVQIRDTFGEAPFLSSSEMAMGQVSITGSDIVTAGSPVVNGAGELVGLVASDQRAVETLEWITPIMRQVLKGETLERPLLGIETVMLDQAIGHEDMGVGAMIVSAPSFGTPARVAGLRVGDILLRVGDHDVQGTMTVARALLGMKPGDVVRVRVKRGEEEFDVDVRLDLRD